MKSYGRLAEISRLFCYLQEYVGPNVNATMRLRQLLFVIVLLLLGIFFITVYLNSGGLGEAECERCDRVAEPGGRIIR
jgi:hypothetical protein